MGTNKGIMKPVEEELEFHDEDEEDHPMSTPGPLSDEEAMHQRTFAIFFIQHQSKKMNLDAIVGYRALQIYDKYASTTTVQEEELERVAISCFTISLRTMDREDFRRILMSNRNLITKEIQRTEDRIVRQCDWELRDPNSFTFLDYFVDKFCNEAFRIPLQEIQKLILKFQKDKKSTRFTPSVITAAAILKITSKLGIEEIFVHNHCTRQIFGEQGFMKGDEVEIQAETEDCASAMEKWYLMMVEKGEISLENWVKDLYEPIEKSISDAQSTSSSKAVPSSSTAEGKGRAGEVSGDDSSSQAKPGTVGIHDDERQGGPSTSSNKQLPSSSSSPTGDKGKEGEVSGDDSSSQVQPQTTEIQEECQAAPSSTEKGKGKESDEKLTNKILQETHTSEIQAIPSSADKGKGIESDEEFTSEHLADMMQQGELTMPRLMEIMCPYTQSPSTATDKGKGKEEVHKRESRGIEIREPSGVKICEERLAGPSSTEKGKGKLSDEEFTNKFLQEWQAVPSSADKGKGIERDEEHTMKHLAEMMQRGELSMPRFMEIMFPQTQPSFTTRTTKERIGFIIEQLVLGGGSTERESAAMQALPIEKTGQRLVGVELNWGDEEEGSTKAKKAWKKVWQRIARSLRKR